MHSITASPAIAADYARAVQAERRRAPGPVREVAPRRVPLGTRVLTALPRLRLQRPVVLS